MTDLKDNITELSHIPPELGPILKKMGSVVQDEWMTRNGVYLNADERKGSKPLSVIESVDMEIRVGNTRYIIGPADPKKPVVSIPVGMSDKTNTAPVPRDWVVGMLGSALITAFGDDGEVFNIVIDRMCKAIDAAAVIDEETGRLSIKQADLPPVRHAVEVAEGLERMKRVFKSRSAGSPKVNFSITAVTDEPAQEQDSMQTRKEAVLSSIMPEPEAQECTITDCPTEGQVNERGICEACEEASGVAAREDAAAEAMASEVVGNIVEAVVGDIEDIELSKQGPHEDNSPEVVRAVLNVAITYDDNENGSTWGQIKKSAAHLYSEIAEDDFRAMLDSTVKSGLVSKTGARRATRYLWNVPTWADPGADMIVEPEAAEVEQKVESTRKDVCRVEECGVALTDEDLKLTGTDLCVGCFSAQELADFAVEEAKCSKCAKPLDERDAALAHTNGLCLPCCDEIDRMVLEVEKETPWKIWGSPHPLPTHENWTAPDLPVTDEAEEEVPWGGPVGLLESNWLDPRPLEHHITDEAGTLIESETKTCAQCDEKHTEGLVKGTAVGERAFCTEACWLDYIDEKPIGISDWASGPAEQEEESSARSKQRHALSGGTPPPRRGA